jgi:hypothetical protein
MQSVAKVLPVEDRLARLYSRKILAAFSPRRRTVSRLEQFWPKRGTLGQWSPNAKQTLNGLGEGWRSALALELTVLSITRGLVYEGKLSCRS